MANETLLTLENSYIYVRQMLSGLLTNMIVAIVILLVGFIIGKILGRLTQKILHEVEVNRILKKATSVKVNLESIVAHFVTYFIYFIAIIMALNQLGLTTTILYIISIAIIALIVLSVFLGIKDFFPNMIAGFFIYSKRFVERGDVIEVKGITGKVERISLVETTLKTKNGDLIYIPNSMFTKEQFKKVMVRKRSRK